MSDYTCLTHRNEASRQLRGGWEVACHGCPKVRTLTPDAGAAAVPTEADEFLELLPSAAEEGCLSDPWFMDLMWTLMRPSCPLGRRLALQPASGVR